MNATYSTSARPPWAVTTWVDSSNIFIEVPYKDNPPLVLKYALSEGGLAKALALMIETHVKHQPRGGTTKIVNAITRKATLTDFDKDMRAEARNVLKKL